MKPELKLRGVVPKVAALNRPLLICVAALVAFILLWLLIDAFKAPTGDKAPRNFFGGKPSNVEAVSPLLNQLPQNYQDVNSIRKYMDQSQVLPPEVTQELNSLRAQESALQTELSQLKSHGTTDTAARGDSMDGDVQAARKSDLFFSSGKPPANLFDDASKTNRNNVTTYNSAANTPYAQQNMQTQKSNFVDATATQGDVYNHYTMIKPASPYEVQAGTIIAANLLTALNTSLPGDIIAQVRQDVYDTVTGQSLLIPKGSKLLGKYDASVAYGQERILIIFNRIIRPDGTSIQLSNFTGTNAQGESGLEGDVNNHWAKILGAATISTMLSFGAGVAADRNSGSNNNTYYPSSQQNAITGAAGNVSQVGQSLTNRAIDIQPTLTVAPGYSFSVIVNKDMVLAPYKGKKL